VFHIVAPNQNQTTPGVNVAGFEDTKAFTRLAGRRHHEAGAGHEAPRHPSQDQNQQDDRYEGEGELRDAAALLSQDRIQPIPHSSFPSCSP
jgi:hypothetical protein